MSFPNQGLGDSLQDFISGVAPQTIEANQFDVTDDGQILGTGGHPLNGESDAIDGTGTELDGQGTTNPGGDGSGTANSLNADIEAERRARLAAEQRLGELERQRAEEAQRAAQEEHSRIQQQINAIQDPSLRRSKQLEYDNYRLRAYAQQQAKEANDLRNENTAANVQRAKAYLITQTMLTNGFPAEVRPLLETAQSPEHLDVIAATLVQQLPRGSAQSAPAQRMQQRIDSGVDTAGGSVASPTIPAGPKARSGDLMGLIQSTPYQRAVLQE